MKALWLFLRSLGSLFLAVVLLAVLAVVLALTTFLESVYGEPVVQYFVYQSWWFYAFLLLLGLNVLSSMLARFPWKKSQLPFLTAHSGILVLLLGCYVTATWNQEANLTLIEGKSARFAVAKGHHFALTPISLEKTKSEKLESETLSETESLQLYAQRLEKEREETIAIPFDGGPFDWKDYQRQNWFDETPRKYRRLLWTFMNLNVPSKNPQASSLKPQASLEVLDYFANSTKSPAEPLKMSVQWNRTEDAANNATPQEDCELYITPQVGTFRGSMLELGLGASQRFHGGERITFRIAESQAEVDAFLNSDPTQITSGIGTVLLTHLGKKYEIPLDEAIRKSAVLRPQTDPLRDQLGDLMRQRRMVRTADSTPTPNSETSNSKSDQLDIESTVESAVESSNVNPINSEAVSRELQLQEIDAKIADLIKKIDALRKESFYTLNDSDYAFEFSQFNPSGPKMESERKDHSNAQQADDKTEEESNEENESNASYVGPMIHVTIHAPNGDTEPMLLFSGRPDMNSQAKRFGFYGTFCFSPTTAKEKEANFFTPNIMEAAQKPRLDLMQTPQGELVYRYWLDSQFVASGKISDKKQTAISADTANGNKNTMDKNTVDKNAVDKSVADKATDVILSNMEFKPHDLPGYNIVSIPFEKDRKYVPQQRAKVRLTLDGVSEEFWILAQFSQQEPYRIPLDEEQVRWLQRKSNATDPEKLIRFTYARNEVDLGFSLYLKKFTQKMEPGTQTASQFSSLVDMRLPEETADRLDLVRPEENRTASFFENSARQKTEQEIVPLQKDVLIKMNQPGLFQDQFTGRKYRVYQSSRQGPYGPGTWEFHYLYDKEILPGETVPREGIFTSVLSVNHDPGRGLKYLGSALLIFGTAWMFYGRKKRDVLKL